MVISDFSIYAEEFVISEREFQNLYLTFPLQFKISLSILILRTKSEELLMSTLHHMRVERNADFYMEKRSF